MHENSVREKETWSVSTEEAFLPPLRFSKAGTPVPQLLPGAFFPEAQDSSTSHLFCPHSWEVDWACGTGLLKV